eukprot:SM000397S15166  [mRNA]  locus=s397:844:2138:- [translate_table: standard]
MSNIGYAEPPTLERVMDTVGRSTARLLCLGDLHGAAVAGYEALYVRPYGPFRHSCAIPMIPHPGIVAAAEGFVKTFTGKDYLAVHMRRGDKYKDWADCTGTKECFWPITDVAECIFASAARANVSIAYVASNAHPWEVRLLGELLAAGHEDTGPVTLLTFPGSFKEQDGFALVWAVDGGWILNRFDENPGAIWSLEKLVCTMAAAFLRSGESAFADHVTSMRAALGTASCVDGTLCEGRERAPIHLPD